MAVAPRGVVHYILLSAKKLIRNIIAIGIDGLLHVIEMELALVVVVVITYRGRRQAPLAR